MGARGHMLHGKRPLLTALILAVLAGVGVYATLRANGAPVLRAIFLKPSGPDAVARGFIGVKAFGDWRLVCARGAAAQETVVHDSPVIDAKPAKPINACRINREVAAAQQPGRVVVSASLSLVGPQRRPALFLRLPATLAEGDPVVLQVNGAEALSTTVRDCTARQCVAAADLSRVQWNHVLAAQQLALRFPVGGRRDVLVSLGTDGLTMAAAAMAAAQTPGH